ncbi:MAG: serine O-acetyltransferase [Deltaproteobacteria bacterium]|nr:MAG: serine O-acetyltransferase [Deltaproteobacteria bacterium]
MFARAREDLEAAMLNDPAARSHLEVFLAYPGVHALWLHRIAHRLWKDDHPLAARVVSHVNRFLTGIEIHPGARIGRRVFIDHGMGIVIGETATVGDGSLLYKGVVLGGTSLERTLRHPQVGRNVVIGSNACVLGGITVGDGAKIGSGSVVIRDVPKGATVVGVPGKIVIDERGRRTGALADHAHADLPDPVALALSRLSERVRNLEAKLGASPGDVSQEDGAAEDSAAAKGGATSDAPGTAAGDGADPPAGKPKPRK